jgi:hypothetical protein
MKRQWLQENDVDDREDRRVRADSKRERRQGDDRKDPPAG